MLQPQRQKQEAVGFQTTLEPWPLALIQTNQAVSLRFVIV